MTASPWDRYRPPVSPGEPRAVFTGKLSDWMAQATSVPEGLFEQERSLLLEKMDRIRDAVDRHREHEIKAALDRALGAGRWTPETLAGRTACAAADGTYLLDGRPLLRIGQPLFTQIEDHLHYTLPVEHVEWSPAP